MLLIDRYECFVAITDGQQSPPFPELYTDSKGIGHLPVQPAMSMVDVTPVTSPISNPPQVEASADVKILESSPPIIPEAPSQIPEPAVVDLPVEASCRIIIISFYV
jgi:hypothetical protein